MYVCAAHIKEAAGIGKEPRKTNEKLEIFGIREVFEKVCRFLEKREHFRTARVFDKSEKFYKSVKFH
jgi:hypothetical protein